MRSPLRLSVVLVFASAAAFPATWSGVLVDSKCYAAEERNVNPHDSLTAVDRDKYQEFWYCSPTKKTRSFAVVQNDNAVVPLDPAANPKIEEVVRQAGKQSPFAVTVTGEQSDRLVRVDTISKRK
jgi:hypothetical protein